MTVEEFRRRREKGDHFLANVLESPSFSHDQERSLGTNVAAPEAVAGEEFSQQDQKDKAQGRGNMLTAR